jgi:hypothetical protein
MWSCRPFKRDDGRLAMKAVMRTASVGVWTRSVNGDLGSLTTSEFFEFRVVMKILSRETTVMLHQKSICYMPQRLVGQATHQRLCANSNVF